jgi:hypothetical protein
VFVDVDWHRGCEVAFIADYDVITKLLCDLLNYLVN